MDRCPVCRAALNGATTCRRCRAELAGVQAVARRAAALAGAAMAALASAQAPQAESAQAPQAATDERARAARLLARARLLHATPAIRALARAAAAPHPPSVTVPHRSQGDGGGPVAKPSAAAP